jgi:hypothetical protein
MKNLISILALVAALLFTNTMYSQTNDSLNQQIQNINLRLDKYSHQNHVGNNLVIWGAISSILGTAIMMSETHSYSSGAKAGLFLVGTGAALTTSGLIVNITSHRKLRSNQYKQRYPNSNN